jgi:hypothetical protein
MKRIAMVKRLSSFVTNPVITAESKPQDLVETAESGNAL